MRVHLKIHQICILKSAILSLILKPLTVALLVFLIVPAAHSNPEAIRLFNEKGRISSDYNKQIQTILQAAEKHTLPLVVQFSKGLSFNVYSVLHGNQNLILDVGTGQVLRIRMNKYTPLRFWNGLLNPTSLVDSLGNYARGYTELIENGVPVPKLKIIPGHENEFLMIEKINIEFSYRDYLDPDFIKLLPSTELAKADNEFLKFVQKTARFRNIGDFGSNQLVYSKDKGWVLVDFSRKHEMAYPGVGGNIFEFDRLDKFSNLDAINSHLVSEIIQKPGLPEHIKQKALEVIDNERSNPSHRAPIQCRQLFEL